MSEKTSDGMFVSYEQMAAVPRIMRAAGYDDGYRAGIKAAADLCDEYTRAHRADYEGLSHSHCKAFGCGDIKRLELNIRALTNEETR